MSSGSGAKLARLPEAGRFLHPILTVDNMVSVSSTRGNGERPLESFHGKHTFGRLRRSEVVVTTAEYLTSGIVEQRESKNREGVVGARGFEPRTSRAQGRRASRLRHAQKRSAFSF